MAALRDFLKNRDGVSAVEFALILPVLITLFLGSVEVTQALTINRKVTLTTGTVGDLVGQTKNGGLDTDELTAILAASRAVMTPYGTEPLSILVTSVFVDEDSNPKVLWSRVQQGATAPEMTPYAADDAFPGLDPVHLQPNTALIVTETLYAHRPTIGYILTDTIELGYTSRIEPRGGRCIKHADETGSTTVC